MFCQVPAPLLPYFESVSNASRERRPREMEEEEEGGSFLEEGGSYLEEGQRLRVPKDVREHYMAAKRSVRDMATIK